MNLLNLVVALIYVHIAALLPRPVNMGVLASLIIAYWVFTGFEITPLLMAKEY